MAEQGGYYPDEASREAAWEADRVQEATPLPGAEVRNYNGDEGLRQADLAAAEKNNIARAAGELGITSDEWLAKRRELGRSPQRGDI